MDGGKRRFTEKRTKAREEQGKLIGFGGIPIAPAVLENEGEAMRRCFWLRM